MRKKTNWKNKTAKKEYLESLVNSKKQEPLEYNKEDNYELGDYINHFKFGPCFVQKIVSNTKIGVFFEDSEKVLMQNWK